MKFRLTLVKWEKDNEYLQLTVTRGRQIQVWWREGPIILRSNVLHSTFRILSFVGPLCKWKKKRKSTAICDCAPLSWFKPQMHPKISPHYGLLFGNICRPEMFHNPESVWDNLIRPQESDLAPSSQTQSLLKGVQMTTSDLAASIPLNLLGDDHFLFALSFSMQF